MAEQKTRARKQILHHICQFSLPVRMGGGTVYPGYKQFHDGPAQVGDLVALQSMRHEDFYLGWLNGLTKGRNEFADQYLVESIETGEECNWSNVGIRYYDREDVRDHPEWRWSDKQWEFKELWDRVCYKDHDAYIVLPVIPDFSPDSDAVTLMTRIRFGLAENPAPKRFDDWRKVTAEEMSEYYLSAVAENKAAKAKPA